jgi:protein gp37
MVQDLRNQCAAAGVKFFLKQLGGHPSKRGGELAVLGGRRWLELPVKPEAALSVVLNGRNLAEKVARARVS